MSEERHQDAQKEAYEPPTIEVIVLGSEEALLGTCFVLPEVCPMPHSTSG